MMDEELVETVAKAIWGDIEWERLSDDYGGVQFEEIWLRARYKGTKDRLIIAARAAIAAMPTWQPIESAPCDPERKVWLARFEPGESIPFYVVQAEWGTAMPGYIHCASYSGWFIDPPIVSDPASYRGSKMEHGIVSMTDKPPTHWCEPIPAPPSPDRAPVGDSEHDASSGVP